MVFLQTPSVCRGVALLTTPSVCHVPPTNTISSSFSPVPVLFLFLQTDFHLTPTFDHIYSILEYDNDVFWESLKEYKDVVQCMGFDPSWQYRLGPEEG